MNAPLTSDRLKAQDFSVAREIDLRRRMHMLIARIEGEAFLLRQPGLDGDAIARTAARLLAAIADAGQA